MSGQTVDLKFRINFPVIMFAVALLHLLSLSISGIPVFNISDLLPKDEPTILKIRKVKSRKVEHAVLKTNEAHLDATAPTKTISRPRPKSQQLDLKDLAIGQQKPQIMRPGTRPEIAVKKTKDMNRISLKSNQFKDFSRSFPTGGLAISDFMAGAQKINDAVVSIEVPDGVEPDELNEYELKFYGFQKRTAINFMNSILKEVDKFQKKYPNYKIPSINRITMTARITYDSEGNVMQIKMVRWTHVNELQNLFEDIVKNIDQLHNPPRSLWEKSGEFSMFYTLEIVNG